MLYLLTPHLYVYYISHPLLYILAPKFQPKSIMPYSIPFTKVYLSFLILYDSNNIKVQTLCTCKHSPCNLFQNFAGTVNTFGVGRDHDSSLLHKISSETKGSYYYIESDSEEKVIIVLKNPIRHYACLLHGIYRLLYIP